MSASSPTRPDRLDRIRGGIWGLLVGDALGVPYEFAPPVRVPVVAKIDFHPPTDFMRSHWGIPEGTWSDDGSQALCLLASLLENDGLDTTDLMNKFCQWYRKGLYAVKGEVFDVGIQTREALERFLSGKPLEECASRGEWSNGNGSLMRVLPLALWHRGTNAELAADAMAQSETTHGHPRAGLVCALYCLWTRRELAGDPHAYLSAVADLEALHPPGTDLRRELDDGIRPRAEDFPAKGSGYVVDTLHSVLFALRQPNFELAAKTAVAFGNDTDTTACVAGGIAGVRHGMSAIPPRWMKALRGKEMVDPLLEKLVARPA